MLWHCVSSSRVLLARRRQWTHKFTHDLINRRASSHLPTNTALSTHSVTLSQLLHPSQWSARITRFIRHWSARRHCCCCCCCCWCAVRTRNPRVWYRESLTADFHPVSPRQRVWNGPDEILDANGQRRSCIGESNVAGSCSCITLVW